MSVQGYFKSVVQFNGRSCPINIYVLDDSCAPVIGRDLLTQLGMSIDFGTMQVRCTQDSSGLQGAQPMGSFGTEAGNAPVAPSVSTECPDPTVSAVPTIVSSFVAQNPALVSKEIGTFPGFEHHIKLSPGAMPVAVKTRAVPYAIADNVADAVRLLDQKGSWEKADKGDWAHPMVTPAKPDGTVHVTTDLSWLNKFVIPVRHPLPTLPEIFQQVRGSAYLSTLDLMKAYHHITLHPDSRPLTLTMTPLGPRQYVNMPLGLKDSSAVFQRCIWEMLQDCSGSVPYIDGILVHEKMKQEHDRNLEWVLRALHVCNFHLQLTKCQFCQKTVKYLGHLLSGSELRLKLDTVAAIEKPLPLLILSRAQCGIGHEHS